MDDHTSAHNASRPWVGLPLAVDKVAAYADYLASQGRGIPARERAPRVPYAALIAHEIGVHPATLCMPRVRAALLNQAATLGYEIRYREREVEGEVSLAELPLLNFGKGVAQCVGCGGRKLREAVSLRVGARIVATGASPDGAARRGLEDAVARGVFSGPDLALARVVLDELQATLAQDGLPDETRARLLILMRRKGLTAVTLARHVGEDPRRLKEIVSGRLRFSPRDDAHFEKWEQLLGVRGGSLPRPGRFGARGNARIGLSGYPAIYSDLSPEERGRLAPYLPDDFSGMPEGEKENAIAIALDLIRSRVTPENAARRVLQRDVYVLRGPLPERLAEEVAAWRQHQAGVQVADGFENERHPWAAQTLVWRENFIRAIGGFLCHPSRGDARLAPADLTMAVLAAPAVFQAFLDFRRARNRAAFGRDFVTDEDIALLSFARSLVRPGAGWLIQADACADRMVPIRRADGCVPPATREAAAARPAAISFKKGVTSSAWLVSSHDVERAQSVWAEFCTQSFEAFGRMIRSIRKRTERNRNSHVPIRAILERDDPMRAFRLMIDGLRRELERLDPSTLAYAEVCRDLALIAVQAQVGLRSRTLLALDWHTHLRKVDGAWTLTIERDLFKNGQVGPFFRTPETHPGDRPIFRDYRRHLVDDGTLHWVLDLYVRVARPRLLRGRGETGAVFVMGRNGAAGRLTQGALQQLVARVWVRHVIHNPLRGTGIEGIVTPAGPHAFRHILATGVWKATGRLQLAADAIHDSPEMVDAHYGHYTAQDRQAVLEDTVARCLGRDRDPDLEPIAGDRHAA